MKTVLFIFSLLFATSSYAQQRIFDCEATSLSRTIFVPDGANLVLNPHILFKDGINWSLQVGDLSLESFAVNGPALIKESHITDPETVRYDFWVDGSYEYEIYINVVDHSAKLYWWGLGEGTFLGNFACEVTEQ